MINSDQSLVTSSRDKSIFIWNVEKQKRIQSFYQTFGSVNSFDAFADGSMLISTGQDRKISLWDTRTPILV